MTAAKTGAALRTAFLRYFERNGHRILPSSSLVPTNDPTLLFTNSGMVQFKEYFLGLQRPEHPRATTAQRCLRVSGKHNDLENVGYTARHHTLFEMLGNFSFGDYFKKESIAFGWEFLTKEVGLDGKRMTVSVFREDDEAYDIWHRSLGLPASQIVRFDEKDNFWSMGPTGPCGPCSEILFDQGEDVGCRKPGCSPGCDCDRFLEIWNHVFMQFDQAEDGSRSCLPRPSIDTGMGLERLAGVVQGVKSNYETDLFTAIISDVSRLAAVPFGRSGKEDSAMRVIADHARATAFLIADGVLPSNEGRGYVLRRVMRRALRHGKKLGFDRPFLHQVAGSVVRDFAPAYPELGQAAAFIDQVALQEEKRFLETLDAGLRMVEDEFRRMDAAGRKVFDGAVAFRLYDTFGFPADLTADLCRERGSALDQPGFDAEMEKQRTQSRASWKGGEVGASDPAAAELAREGLTSEFVGYEALAAPGRVVALLKDGARVPSAPAGAEVELLSDVTPFYGEGGGQVGDVGEIRGAGFRLEVSASRRPAPEVVLHRCRVIEGIVQEGAAAELAVAEGVRRRTQGNHTATHLLQAALREVLGPHVRQAGSYVGPDKLRFDFTHFEGTAPEQLSRVEELVNQAIFAGRPVDWEVLPYDAAIAAGATAFFGEKYGETVRMVSVPGVSRELCGGTHVANTAEIGLFRILSESALAAGVRRIEAATGPGALESFREDAAALREAASDLRSAPREVPDRVRRLLAQAKGLEKELADAKRRSSKDLVSEVAGQARQEGGVTLVAARVEAMDAPSLRELADGVKGRMGSGLLLLASVEGERCHLVAGVSADLTGRFSAGDIVKKAAAHVGGGGGGRKDMAQAGGGRVDGVDAALASLAEWVR